MELRELQLESLKSEDFALQFLFFSEDISVRKCPLEVLRRQRENVRGNS